MSSSVHKYSCKSFTAETKMLIYLLCSLHMKGNLKVNLWVHSLDNPVEALKMQLLAPL